MFILNINITTYRKRMGICGSNSCISKPVAKKSTPRKGSNITSLQAIVEEQEKKLPKNSRQARVSKIRR